MEHNSSGEEESITSTSTRIACTACRAIKVKCDRKEPCSRCIKKKIECVYSTRRRPGPTQGRALELRQIIQQLRTDLEEQKERNEALERAYQTISKGMEHDDIKLGGHMTNMNTLNTYISVYFDKGFTFLQVYPPFQDLNDYYKKNDVRSPLMNAIFGVGSLISGNQEHANMFLSKVESSAQSAFDEVSPYICAMNFVLSGYYTAAGDEERELSYNNRALTMAGILKKRSPATVKGPNIDVIQRYATIKQALHSDNLNLIYALFNELNKSTDEGQCSFAVAHIENNILIWAIQAIHNLDMDFIQPDNISQMYALFSFADRLVLKLHSPMQQMLLMRLCAAKVLVYMLALHDDIAHEVAQQMLAIVSNPVSILIDHPYFTLGPLLIVGQYFMLFGTFTNEFQMLLHVLNKVDTTGLVQSILLSTRKVSPTDMVAWCYVYPHLTAYRERSAEVLQFLRNIREDDFSKRQIPRIVEYENSPKNEPSSVRSVDSTHEGTDESNSEGLQLELNLDSFVYHDR